MGKKGKALRSQIKSQAKRAKKSANRAKYAAWRDAGTNSKSFRQRKKAKKNGTGDKGKHLIHNCGNVGCLKCNPEERKPMRVLGIQDSLKLIRQLFPNKPEKPQVHPGRNLRKSRRA